MGEVQSLFGNETSDNEPEINPRKWIHVLFTEKKVICMEKFEDLETEEGDIVLKKTEDSLMTADKEFVKKQIETGGTTEIWKQYVEKWKNEGRI